MACLISLPTAARFRAKLRSAAWHDFDIFRLNGAAVDSGGTVRLADGTLLRAVEVIPANLPNEPSELAWRIVRYAVELAGAQVRCYRHLADGLPLLLREKILNTRIFEPLADPNMVRVYELERIPLM